MRRRGRRQAQRRSGSRSTTWPTARTTRCSRRCASACASTTARRAAGAIGVRCVFSREAVRAAGAARCLRRRRQPQLPRLRLERHRDGDLRHGGRGARARMRWLAARRGRGDGPPRYNHGLAGLLAQLVEQRTFNPLVAGSSPAQPTTQPSEAATDFGLLAQLVEQRTLNPLVECSSHSGPTNKINGLGGRLGRWSLWRSRTVAGERIEPIGRVLRAGTHARRHALCRHRAKSSGPPPGARASLLPPLKTRRAASETNATGQMVLKLKKPLEFMQRLAATRHGKTGGRYSSVRAKSHSMNSTTGRWRRSCRKV